MIVSILIAANIAAQPLAPTPPPGTTPAGAGERKMACCEKMAKGEGCGCCTGKDGDSHKMDGKHDQDGPDR